MTSHDMTPKGQIRDRNGNAFIYRARYLENGYSKQHRYLLDSNAARQYGRPSY